MIGPFGLLKGTAFQIFPRTLQEADREGRGLIKRIAGVKRRFLSLPTCSRNPLIPKELEA